MAYRRRYYKRREEEYPIDFLFDAVFEIVLFLGRLIGEILFQIFKFIFDRRDKIGGVFGLKSKVEISKDQSLQTNSVAINDVTSINKDVVDKSNRDYVLKTNQITDSEKNFLSVLKEIVGTNYIIATQVPISSIVTANKSNHSYFNKIRAKTIDFVLFRSDYSPYLAIELDDRSHFRWDRRRRDEFVNNLMKGVGLRLLRIRSSYKYDPEEIKKEIFNS